MTASFLAFGTPPTMITIRREAPDLRGVSDVHCTDVLSHTALPD